MGMIAEKLPTEEKQQALDLVSQSQTFARSDRLRGLLQFICQAEIEGRQDSLNEYVIGAAQTGAAAIVNTNTPTPRRANHERVLLRSFMLVYAQTSRESRHYGPVLSQQQSRHPARHDSSS